MSLFGSPVLEAPMPHARAVGTPAFSCIGHYDRALSPVAVNEYGAHADGLSNNYDDNICTTEHCPPWPSRLLYRVVGTSISDYAVDESRRNATLTLSGQFHHRMPINNMILFHYRSGGDSSPQNSNGIARMTIASVTIIFAYKFRPICYHDMKHWAA